LFLCLIDRPNMQKIQRTLWVFTILLSKIIWAQSDTLTTPDPIKTGWSFGLLPAVSYNSDMGFQYGGVVNFFHHGDGSNYPKYNHSLFLEISRFTKGSGINRFFYDSEQLIPGLRTTADISLLTEKALDFYGFNGYDAVYNPEWENDNNPQEYVSRMFYRHERRVFKFTVDLQGKIKGNHLRWLAGIALFNTQVAPVDIDALNKGRDEQDLLPDVPGLYDRFVEWGVISNAEKEGGWNNHLRLGIVYDTRDFEPNPMQGMWSEMILFASPAVAGNDFGYTKLSLTHRQYIPVLPQKLTLALRAHYQGTLTGEVPFYMQPYLISSFYNAANTDALGGARTLRGVLRNRVVGDGIVMGNAELRWRSATRTIFKQHFYLGVNAFFDTGRVVKKIDVNTSGVPENEFSNYFDLGAERFHSSLGAGLRVVMNENFIVAFDYGKPLDTRDGNSGLYIGLNYLF